MPILDQTRHSTDNVIIAKVKEQVTMTIKWGPYFITIKDIKIFITKDGRVNGVDHQVSGRSWLAIG